MYPPILSILMAYRGRPETDISIHNLFESIYNILPLEKFELLIKMDSDDTHGKLIIKDLIKEFPNINIKLFVYKQGEGRWNLDGITMYLFTRRNPLTKWITFLSDDSIFSRNPFPDIEKFGKDYYLIGDYKSENTPKKLDLVKDYHYTDWLTPEYLCGYIIISSKLIEIMGNLGYQSNMDGTLGLINIIMFKKYGIIFSKHIKEFIIRNNIDRKEDYDSIEIWNKDWHINDRDIPKDEYFFTLTEQQCHNIYLNFTEKKL